jgi:hypothetical protein
MASIINSTFPSNQTTSQELATSQLKRSSLSANSNGIKGADQVDYYPRKLPILFISPETFSLERESLRGKSRTQNSVCQVSTLANKHVRSSRAPTSRHQSYSNDSASRLNSATRLLTKLGSSSARLASNLLKYIAVTSGEFLHVAQRLYENLLANPTKEISPVGSFTSIEEMVGNGLYSPYNTSLTNKSSRPIEP